MGTHEGTSGLTAIEVAPLRYSNNASIDPHESTAMISEMIPYGARVLDVGCGTGSITSFIQHNRKADIVGIEPHPQRAQAARELGLEVRQGELTNALLTELGTFDVILFADVLEHLINPGAILETVRDGLRPGGTVVASVPNVAHWSIRLDLLRGRFNYQSIGLMDATHLRWFTALSLRRLFEMSGFEVVDMRASAGNWMADYRYRKPWRWISEDKRRLLVQWLTRQRPTLFGCQHIVRATLRNGEHKQ